VAVAALGAGLLAALTMLPYLGPLAAAQEWNILIAEKPGLGVMLESCLATLGAPSPAVAWVWGGLVLSALIGAAVSIHWRKTDPGPDPVTDAQLFRLLVIPAACAGQLALFLKLAYLPRIWYVLPLMALVASALDGLLAGVRLPALRMGRLAVPFLIAALALPVTLQRARTRMTNVDHVAQELAADAAPQDLVVVNYWFFGISFQRYYDAQAQGAARWMTMPRIEDHRFHRYDLFKVKMMAADPNRDVIRAIRRTLRSGHRVWVVGTLDSPPPGQPARSLPPAPGAPSGWSDAPYCLVWSEQLTVYLETHARQHIRYYVRPTEPVNGYEHLALHAFQWWKEEAAR
jgi:hypothetical protein